MFPHTVTLYSIRSEISKDTFEEKTTVYITVLEGVLLEASKAYNVRESGMAGAAAVNLYIPFDVKATDGVTGAEKTYLGPVEFWPLEQKEKFWTIQAEPNTFFVKGKVVEPNSTFERISLAHDDVYNVTKVDRMDFGGLQHFEVGGN